MTKISINQNDCIGCSFCMNCNPDIFKFDENNFKGKLKDGEKLVDVITVSLSEERLKKTKEAVENCPVKAISIN